ncbi:mCG144704, partial [Mus musculus]
IQKQPPSLLPDKQQRRFHCHLSVLEQRLRKRLSAGQTSKPYPELSLHPIRTPARCPKRHGCIHVGTSSEDLMPALSGRQPVPPHMPQTSNLEDPHSKGRFIRELPSSHVSFQLAWTSWNISSDCLHLTSE